MSYHSILLYGLTLYHIIYHATAHYIILAPARALRRQATVQADGPVANLLGIHHRGVQWEGGAVDGGSII